MTSLTLRLAVSVVLIGGALLPPGAEGQARSSARDLKIQLQSLVFDPLEGPPAAPEALLLAPSETTDYWIVQFRRPLTREDRVQIAEEYGVRLTEYVPSYAYIERLSTSKRTELERHGAVRAVVAYQPAFKISQDLHRRSSEGAGLALVAILFAEADAEAVASAVRSIDGASQIQVRDLREHGAAARIQLRVEPGDSLVELARIEGVRWIEEVAKQDEDSE